MIFLVLWGGEPPRVQHLFVLSEKPPHLVLFGLLENPSRFLLPVMRQPCVEASPECVKGVLDGLGVPEYGYRLLGIVHDDKPALHARFSAFRPFFVFRLGQTYILLVSCDICQPVDVPFTGVVGQFADTPPVFRTFAERENGIAVFVLGVVFGEVRRLREIGRRLSQLPRSRCGRWPKSRE